MKVAVLHYHLKPGGVTRVIDNARRALGKKAEFAIFCGDDPGTREEDIKTLGATIIKGLEYRSKQSFKEAVDLATTVRKKAKEHFGSTPDVWHIHNHSLGKNLALPVLVNKLAESGERILLQIHDFAEDGRPDNYRMLLDNLWLQSAAELAELVYPSSENVHYAILNGRDFRILKRSGVPNERLHLLSNPVFAGKEPPPSRKTNLKRILYPVRAIRRKNLGEFLLWSTTAAADERFGVTLAPKNPATVPIYNRWKEFAEDLSLPVDFELGEVPGRSFEEVIASASIIASTSIAEGFGLSFLEPWLFGKSIIGRNLPEITSDFTESGINLSKLYCSLEIPAEWVDKTEFKKKYQHELRTSFNSYGREISDKQIDHAFDNLCPKDKLEFSRLDEALQESVIRKAASSVTFRNTLRELIFKDNTDSPELIRSNKKCVKEEYNLEKYGRKLAGIYSSISHKKNSAKLPSLDGEKLLDEFLMPERFRLLRT